MAREAIEPRVIRVPDRTNYTRRILKIAEKWCITATLGGLDKDGLREINVSVVDSEFHYLAGVADTFCWDTDPSSDPINL